MDLQALRAQTRIEHEGTEAQLPLMSPDLTLLAYVEALRGLYRVIAGWERWAGTQAPPAVQSLLQERQRSRLLRADLHVFGVMDLPEPLPSEVFDALLAAGPETASPQETAVLGALYVVEGSTLGGQYIACHVKEVLHLELGEGNAYFVGYGEQTGERWREVRALLAAAPEDWLPATVAAAKRTFGIFGSALRDTSGAPSLPEASRIESPPDTLPDQTLRASR